MGLTNRKRLLSAPLRAVLAVLTFVLLATASFAQPPATTGIWAFAGATSVTLHWNPVFGATSYTIYRSTSTGTEASYKTGVTGSSLSDTGLTANTLYYYKVQAFYGASGGALSTECSCEPGSTALASPIAYAVTLSSEVKLNFTGVAGATSYHVFRTLTGSSAYTLVATETSKLQYVDSSVSAGVSYSYLVTASDVDGDGGVSDGVTAIPGDSPGAGSSFVTASPVTGPAVSVFWNPVPNATGYLLLRGTAAAGPFSPIAVSTTF